MPSVTLHRCPLTFLHTETDKCYVVQKALDEQGVDYTIAKQPLLPRGRRKDVKRMTDDVWLPVIEFEDGSVYREESKDMAATIRAGRLFDRAGAGAGTGAGASA